MKGIGEGGSARKQQGERAADEGRRREKGRPGDADVLSLGVSPSVRTQSGLDVVGHVTASNGKKCRFSFFPPAAVKPSDGKWGLTVSIGP